MTPTATTSKRTLSTAEARREAVLEAGMKVFAEKGFLGTPTTEVAKAAGISQAYLFRLFPTKTDLVLAIIERSNERLLATMTAGLAKSRATGADPFETMGEAYSELLEDRTALLTQVHQHAAAASMPEVAAASRAMFEKLYTLVSEATGASEEEMYRFFATGMLLNVMAAIGATDEHGPWAQTLRVC